MINFTTLNMPAMRFMVGRNPSALNSFLMSQTPRGIGGFNSMLGHTNPIFLGFAVQPPPLISFPPLFKGTGVVLGSPVPTSTFNMFGHPNTLGLFA